jgi:hypothetical protein
MWETGAGARAALFATSAISFRTLRPLSMVRRVPPVCWIVM